MTNERWGAGLSLRNLRHFYDSNFKPNTPFCIYRNYPLLCFSNNHPEVCGASVIFLFYLCVFFIPILILNFFSDTITSPSLASDFVQDLQYFPIFRIINAVCRLSHLPITGTPAVPQSAPVSLPYLRDYCLISVQVLMAAHMALIHKQWHNISIALPSMWESRVINRKVLPKKQYTELLEGFDRLFNHRGWDVLCYALSAVLTALLFWSFASHGMASGLNPTRTSAWELNAYAGWWSNHLHHPAAFVVNVLMIWVILFYMLRHNVVGVLSIYMTMVVLKKGKSISQLFHLQTHHPDQVGGIGIIRRIMLLVYLSITIMGFALLFTYYSITSAPDLRFYILIPFAFIFFILNPFYLLSLHTAFRRLVTSCKHERINELRKSLQQLDLATESAQRLVILDELKEYEALPIYLFRTSRLMLFLVTYILPTILFVDWAALKFSRP